MSPIMRKMPTTLAGRGRLLQVLGVVLAERDAHICSAAEPMYAYCISHADEPECNPWRCRPTANGRTMAATKRHTRYSALKQINTSNVKNLRMASMHSTRRPRVAGIHPARGR